MATSTLGTNAKFGARRRFLEGVGMVDPSWEAAFDRDNTDAPTLKLVPITGVGNLPTWDGTSNLTTDSMVELDDKTISYQAYGVQVRVNALDAVDINEIVGMALEKLGFSLASTYANVAATARAAGFSTETVHASKPVYSSTHETAGGTRSNLLSSALDRSAFMVMIQKARKWTNYQDQVLDLSMGGWILEVPPELEYTAHQIIDSGVSSSQMQANVAGRYNTSVVVNPRLTDANDWTLTSKMMTPWVFWQRLAPQGPTIRIDQDNQVIKINLYFAIKAAARATPDGAFGAGVA